MNKNKAGKLKKDRKLRLFGKVFKLLEEYSKIEKIDSSFKTKLEALIEPKNDITEVKLVAVLYLIMERHLREKNEEFKLNDILLTEKNTQTEKRYKLIFKNVPETNESLLLKLILMTTVEKVNYFDKSDSTKDEKRIRIKYD